MPIHISDGTISQSHQSSTFGIASDSANCCRIFICSTWSAIGCVRFCDLMVCCNMVLSHNNSTTLSHLSRKQHNVQTSAFNTFNIFLSLHNAIPSRTLRELNSSMSLVTPSLVGNEFESAQRHSEFNSEEWNYSMSIVVPSLVGSEFESAQRHSRQ